MKKTIRVITIAVLFILFPYFNSSGLKAEKDENVRRTGKVISLNINTGIGLIQDDITGKVYEFSYNGASFIFFQNDKVNYTFDPVNAGRVIVGPVIRR